MTIPILSLKLQFQQAGFLSVKNRLYPSLNRLNPDADQLLLMNLFSGFFVATLDCIEV